MFYKIIKGVKTPALGLGTFGLKGEQGTRAITQAIEIGYRHLDTAIRYANEMEVGLAIQRSGVSRGDLFITTKIWPSDFDPELIRQRTAESLERLQTDYVDQLVIHWPNKDVPLDEVLGAFQEQKDAGRTRQIGVSNFTTKLLNEATKIHKADLFANQVEYHPFLRQQKVLAVTREAGMLLTAYLPLARGAVFDSPLLQAIGERHGKTAGQVSLRWLLQQENVAAIPRSSKVENIRSNFDIFDFELSDAEMTSISNLATGRRIVEMEWSPEWDEE